MFIYTIFKVRALPSMGRSQRCHGNRWRCGRMDGWSRSQPCPGAKPHLWFGASHLRGWALLCPGSRCWGRWEKEKLALRGEFQEVFLILHTIPLVFPHLEHFLLVTQGHAGDGCWQVWLFLSLVVQASSASSILCSHKCHQCHICQLPSVYLPSSQCMCNYAYTHMGDTGEHLFSTFPELNLPFL